MNRFMILLLVSIASFTVEAGVKDDFIKKVQTVCKVSKEEAKKLATPGRTGNVVKLKLCPTNPVKISPNCKVNCGAAAGNVVGN